MIKKKLLLHICCGSCAVYVMEKLKNNYELTGFFYNPNIHPAREYEFRKKELERAVKIKNWNVVYGEHDMENWLLKVKGYEKEPERGKRCTLCFNIRLKKAFEYAKNNSFDIVASTLSISPYKVTKQINEEGKKLADAFRIEFLPENFKKQNGFNIGKKMAQELEIKHQNYCGCVYSKVEKGLRSSSDDLVDIL